MNAQELKICSQPSRPLVNPAERLMLIFSPKSACSTSVIWLFHRMGLAQEAEQYDHWPHKYRIERFYSRPEVQEGMRLLPLQELRIVKIMRDPIDRAVSSFRHALGTVLYAREPIRAALGIDIATQGLSFRQFIDFLETEDLRKCNPHHSVQAHPIEELVAPHFIINISKRDLFEGLNAFEAQCGLSQTNFANLTWLHDVQQRRSPVWTEVEEDLYERVFFPDEAKHGPWPRRMMSECAQKRLAELYQSDLLKYAEHL